MIHAGDVVTTRPDREYRVSLVTFDGRYSLAPTTDRYSDGTRRQLTWARRVTLSQTFELREVHEHIRRAHEIAAMDRYGPDDWRVRDALERGNVAFEHARRRGDDAADALRQTQERLRDAWKTLGGDDAG